MRTHLIKVLNSLSTALALSLCASASTLAATHTIGGTIKGLTSSNSVTLLDDGTDALKVTANGAFTFKTPLAAGASYNVTIGTQPTDELCTVSHGSGLANANISSVLVSCVRTFSIGGTLSGLKSGDSVTLLDNRKDALPLTANGKFTFSTSLTTGAAYSVTVITEPLGEKCTISHANGVVAANVTNIAVSCVAAPMFTIGGSVSGLRAGDSVTLLDNGADPLKVSSNSTFKFKTPLDSGTLYKVTVGTQPSTGDCKVSAATGIVRSSNITTVKVTCVPTFSIGGTLTGLKSGDSLTLLDNRTDALTLTANGKFTFATRLPSGSAYRLGISITPLGEKCTVTHGVGVVAVANVTNISVSCVTAPTHTVGGIISGLKTGDQITLLDNGADALTLTASGPFTFKTPLESGTVYKVTIGTQPPGEDCTVAAATGVIANANITSVKVTCTTAGTHTIGGTVSGLKTGNSVTLLDNGADALKVTADGRFTFKTPLAPGASYAVTVGTQPAGQICTITNGSGKVPRANVTNVTAICTAAPTFTIGGTLSGLTPGALLSLFNNGADQLNLATNGAFAFRLGLLPGAAYNVTIAAQPTGETCTVSNGSGTVGTSNVTTVSVSCKANPTFIIGGTVSGLNTGASVTLLDNATDSLTVSTNGAFTFKTALATGAAYNVTVNTQPVGETCTVTGATGTVASSNVTTVSVSCKANPTFTIGGTVSGLSTGASVTLLDNATDSLTVSTNGAFTFKTALATGAAYNVTVNTQPVGETCTVTGATGTVASSNVTTVSVSCKANPTFTIGGTVSGLNTGASVTLLDNATDSLTVSTNGTFTFKTALATGAGYNVTIASQPSNETCTITNASGTVASANVSNVSVSCVTNTFTIGGTVNGLNSGASVTLLDNATDSLTIITNGTFTFKTPLATGATYNVTLATQPTNETCTITNASGTVVSANITNVSVSCATNTFTIGGTVSGLNTGASVTLLDNATDSLTVGTNGAFTFKIAHATGAAYSVTVSTQPTGQTCTITNGTGTVASANITNVNVSCSSGTGGSGTFWTPYTASPVPGTSGGSTGLFIMPSDNLESSPAPQFVTTAQPHFLGSAFQFTFGNGTVTSTPAVFIYAAAGTDGNTHVYGLKVGDTSTVPTPTQLSSLSLSPSQQICGFSQAQTSLADPTTVFTILDVSPGQCGTGGDIFEVVRYQDSPTTAPTPVSINTTLIYTLYQDGNLAGLILYDTNAQSLNLYADGTFTSPKQLATGSASLGLRLATLTDGTTFGGTVAYFNVTTSSGPALYRIDSSSLTLSQVHQGVLGLVAVPDKNNLYFTDVTSLSTTVFYQVPLTGGTPTAIYSAPYTSGLSSYLLLGTDDSVLAFQFLTTIGSPIGTTTNFFYSIPIGTTSTTATTLGGPYVGNVTAVVASPKLADFAGTVIFVDIINKLAGTPQQTAYSSVALPLSGTTNTTPLANSSYPPMGPTRIVQVTGITDVDGGQGGGTLSNIDLNTLQGTILTTTGGQPYVIPAGYVPGPVSLGSNFVGGQLVPFPGTTGPSIGLAGDLSNNFILPINLPNTNVSIF
jgi:predicted SpoU family rRNA methylase